MTRSPVVEPSEYERLGYRLVELDGRQVSLPVVALASLGLGPQDPVPAHLQSRLEELARTELTYQVALRALSARARAGAELRRWLLDRYHHAKAVETALDRLALGGWLDDRRFALEYVARRARAGRGPARLVTDLMARGVERATAETAVREALAESGEDPERRAEALARRRAPHLSGLAPAVRRRRLLGYLARRGFRGPSVGLLVARVCQESP